MNGNEVMYSIAMELLTHKINGEVHQTMKTTDPEYAADTKSRQLVARAMTVITMAYKGFDMCIAKDIPEENYIKAMKQLKEAHNIVVDKLIEIRRKEGGFSSSGEMEQDGPSQATN